MLDNLPATITHKPGCSTRLDRALSQHDIAAATEIFLPDSFWRDIVAFTWNIYTAEGRDDIGRMLDACLSHAEPSGWTINGPARLADGIVEAAFTFETLAGRGAGIIRLKDGRCWTLLTALRELKGHEETIRGRRPLGAPESYRLGRQPWRIQREQDSAQLGVTRQPYCLIVGAGHCGLALAARLKQLDVPTLLVDRLDRPSDTWRNRYDTLTFNSPSAVDHMAYMPFPEIWPAFPSKDQLANWLALRHFMAGDASWSVQMCQRTILAALWEAGADVTMVQRSPVVVVRRETLLGMFGQRSRTG